MACAALVGTLVVTLAVLGVDVLRAGWWAGPAAVRSAAAGSAAVLLLGGTLGGLLAAGLAAWLLLAPLGSMYRRGALAIVSSFATVLLMLVGMPVHQRFGQPGLLALAAVLAVAAWGLALRTSHAARDS